MTQRSRPAHQTTRKASATDTELPGRGHQLIRKYRRPVVVFTGFFATVGLLAWLLTPVSFSYTPGVITVDQPGNAVVVTPSVTLTETTRIASWLADHDTVRFGDAALADTRNPEDVVTAVKQTLDVETFSSSTELSVPDSEGDSWMLPTAISLLISEHPELFAGMVVAASGGLDPNGDIREAGATQTKAAMVNDASVFFVAATSDGPKENNVVEIENLADVVQYWCSNNNNSSPLCEQDQ